ncbi:MAG: hypothetical protein HYR63_08660 [Proteobacteria bacterium]|nr:hypothetical protein [Pseudomonadota bacterium]
MTQQHLLRPYRAPTRAPLPAPPLLDSIDISYGPRPLLSRSITLAVGEADRAGVRLVFYKGTRELNQVNLANRDSWSPLNPMLEYDPDEPELDRAWSIIGYADDGSAVATAASRLVLCIDSTLKQQAESLRLFHPRRSSRPEPGERFEWLCPSAEHISGRVMWSAAVWHRPDYRGRGLSHVIPRLARALGHAIWGARYACGVVRTHQYETKLGEAYGYPHNDLLLRWVGPKIGGFEGALSWITEEENLFDLERYIRTRH